MNSARGTALLDKGLALLASLVRDRGETPLRDIAAAIGIPPSSARRMTAALERQGLVMRRGSGRYAAGMALSELAPFADAREVLTNAARPLLRALAHRYRVTAHLGILDGDMVTYLAKEHGGGLRVFTREDEQLEAYCSGVGKILIARLDDAARENYLANGPFVSLTERTLVDPAALRVEFQRVRALGYAIDDREVADDIRCVAVALAMAGGIQAAISLSGAPDIVAVNTSVTAAIVEDLARCAAAIGRRLSGRPGNGVQ